MVERVPIPRTRLRKEARRAMGRGAREGSGRREERRGGNVGDGVGARCPFVVPLVW